MALLIEMAGKDAQRVDELTSFALGCDVRCTVVMVSRRRIRGVSQSN